MLGRSNKEEHVYVGGGGTFAGGEDLLRNLGKPNKVAPIVHAGSVGGSISCFFL